MKKFIVFLISLLVTATAVFIIYQQRSSWLQIFSGTDSRKGDSKIFFAKLDNFIRQNHLDSVSTYLDRAISQQKDKTAGFPSLDTLQSLHWQVKQIGLLDTGNIYIGILLNLSDREYENFLNNKLDKHFLGHPGLNRIYLNKLYQKNNRYAPNQNQAQSPGGSLLHSPGSSELSVSDASARRKEFAETIKKSFESLGFDITVELSGADNSVLILTAAEFNDEWFEKFESDSDMAEWHNLGFRQIEIRNNSGYTKIKSW